MAARGLSLSDRDQEILDALTLRVRVMSIGQIARQWFDGASDPVRQTKRRLAALAKADLVELASIPTRPELTLDKPLVTWRPGEVPPAFERLASFLDARWKKPAILTDLVIASRKAGIARGGHGGRWPRRSEVSHDLTFAGLYLAWRKRAATSRDSWTPESRLRREGMGDNDRLPDAAIEKDGHRRIVELAGVYSAAKLRDLHRFCAERELPYELW